MNDPETGLRDIPDVGVLRDARGIICTGRKVISLQASVEYLPVQLSTWAPAKILPDLLVQDRVNTLSRSRAVILFKDETQVLLSANARWW